MKKILIIEDEPNIRELILYNLKTNGHDGIAAEDGIKMCIRDRANIISRFFDADEGQVFIGGVDVKEIPKAKLMETVSFVFQNSRLLKGSILENVRMARPSASEEDVLQALKQAQCIDIIAKLPDGIHTILGTEGIYLSGGCLLYTSRCV